MFIVLLKDLSIYISCQYTTTLGVSIQWCMPECSIATIQLRARGSVDLHRLEQGQHPGMPGKGCTVAAEWPSSFLGQ